MKRFTNLYQLSKTLRFELKPIGKTLENIKKHGLLEQDTHRAENYVKVKEIIDKYHKAFIEECLNTFTDSSEIYAEQNKKFETELFEFEKAYKDKNDLKSPQSELRKIIAKSFNNEKYKRLFGKELIKEDLIGFLKDNVEDITLVQEFKDFTTYFTGFHENRKNMYSDEDKSTAIAYRLIHENLPRFIDNILVFEKIAKTSVAQDFTELYKNFESFLNVNEISEMFKLDYYNMVLTQTQIDVYNAIIGGKTIEDSDIKIKGLNEYINLYNQQQKDKHNRLPKLKPLYKQILSDRNAISWLPEQFDVNEKGGKVLEAIQKAYNELEQQILNNSNEAEHSLTELLESLSNYDLSKIYIPNDAQLTDLSQKVYGHWNIISKALLEDLKLTTPRKSRKETDEKYEERLNKILKSQSSFSIRKITDSVHNTYPEIKSSIITYFENIGNIDNEEENIISKITNSYNIAKDLLNTPYTGNNLSQDTINVEKIKNLLDAIKDLQHFIKPLLGKGDESEKDEKFYGEFTLLWDELNNITPLYNMVRNYMTRKPYSTEKIKLNFENSTLLDGWDLNKETDNTSIILRKDGIYYLAIMNKKHNRVFDIDSIPTEGECFEKMEYKFFKDLTTMVPKCTTQTNDVKKHFSTETLPYIIKNPKNFNSDFIITKEEFDLNNILYNGKKKFQKDYLKESGDYIGYKNALTQWIRFCLRFVSQYKSTMIYDTSLFNNEDKINSYQSLDEFYKEINLYLYKISFRKISSEYINSLVEDGKIYLFKIYNKDFSSYSKGTPNMHTLYWKMLFDDTNMSDVCYKLNGQAKVFFRKSSIKIEHPTHPANQPIENKNTLSNKKQSVFKYDLIKDKRYTIDKFQFHVHITMNFKGIGINNINNLVNQFIQEQEDLHIIGIDRGERHLLYLTVIDLLGNIKEQYSLNEIINNYNGNTYKTNYHDLLAKREKERMDARQSWKSIESIKELKEGYLSQVIHKITELMVKYNAIVVLEDLNMGFMRGRQKVEASVYQKFEKMLIDKLNYLVDKKKQPEELGGTLNALQLTNKFESFQKLGKQSGFLFYTQAWNTSKIDPVTGFVNLFDTRYETREKAKDFFKKFDAICYNAEKDWFEFSFDYNNLTTKAEGTRTNWTLCTYGKRIETFRDKKQNSQWISNEINLTEKFKSFFEKYNIELNDSLKESIVSQDSAEFFKGLLSLLRLTLQLRNSEINSDVDYLQSPVADNNGVFFNSQECDNSLPQNADANGAYNIARKGLWIVNQIKNSSDISKVKLAISNKEWLKFAQEKPYLLND